MIKNFLAQTLFDYLIIILLIMTFSLSFHFLQYSLRISNIDTLTIRWREIHVVFQSQVSGWYQVGIRKQIHFLCNIWKNLFLLGLT